MKVEQQNSFVRVRVGLSFPFFLLGLACFGAALVIALVTPELFDGQLHTPRVQALLHLLVLGWLGSLVFGAAYQIVPVLAETDLVSPLLARVHILLHGVGLPLLVFGFLLHHGPLLALGSAGMLAGIIAMIGNLIWTANARSRWSASAVAVVLSLSWLGIVVLLALWLVLERTGHTGWPVGSQTVEEVRTLHAHLGLAGFFLQLLIGVSWKLLPMFAASGPHSKWVCVAVLVLLNSGILLLGPALPGGHPNLLLGAEVLILCAVVLFVLDSILVLHRGEKGVDASLFLFMFGLVVTIPASAVLIHGLIQAEAMGDMANLNRSALLATSLFVGGTLTCSIFGMGGKLLPNLAWQHFCAPRLGKEKVPEVQDLVRHPWLDANTGCMIAAVILFHFGLIENIALFRAIGLTAYLAGLIAFVIGVLPALKVVVRSEE